jgi:hypothetical protein
MQKANLYCPKQKVFRGQLLMNQSVIPNGRDFGPSTETSPVEVEILEVQGEQALVLLPNFMANNENATAIVEIEYLV